VFAADQDRPRLLEDEGFAAAGTRFTYAIGRLVLWSPNPAIDLEDGVAVLRAGRFRKLAMANPRVAPYGLAAQEVLETLGLAAELKDRIVQGENIAQTHAMIATGSADLGFTALSYVTSHVTNMPGTGNRQAGTVWHIPPDLYSPIRQDAVLMTRAKDNDAARAFFAYAGSAQAREIIRAYGFQTEPAHSNPAGTNRVQP
jgi:molybdate transport system substrate-binding protein